MPTSWNNCINKILRVFGLMTVEQAKHINQETVALMNRWVADKAREDFGVLPNERADRETRQWADDCFDLMLDHKHYDGDLIGAWEL